MRRSVLLLCALTFFANQAVGANAAPGDPPQQSRAVVHQVSVGGADVCDAVGLPTGCDANLSIEAILFADGTASGQWSDVTRFGGDGPAFPIHIAVDCLYVEGNRAWVGGAVTLPQDFPIRFVTTVIDNGTAPRDPADQIGLLLSESFFGPCTDAPDDPLIFDLVHGQVTIR